MGKKIEVNGFTETISQIKAFQKDNMDRIIKAINERLGETNPVKFSVSEKTAAISLKGGLSEFLDITEKMFREMNEISKLKTLILSEKGGEAAGLLIEDLPETPAQIIQKLLEILPVPINRYHKEKINTVLEKLTIYNTVAVELLYCSFIPLEEATQTILKEIVKHSESADSFEDTGKIYRYWVKILENEYQAMVRTERYQNVLLKIFSAMDEYYSATLQLAVDLIQMSECSSECEADDFFKIEKTSKSGKRELKFRPDSFEGGLKIVTSLS